MAPRSRSNKRASTRRSRHNTEEEEQEEVEEVEDEEITQRSRAEDIQDDHSDDPDPENDEEEPSANANTSAAQSRKRQKSGADKGKIKAKQNGRAKSKRIDSGNGEPSVAPNGEYSQLDIENFPDQALSWPEDKERITQIANDWQQIRGKLELESTQLLVDVATAMAEAAEGKDGREAKAGLKNIDASMRQLIDMNAHMEAYQKTLVEIANDLAREEIIDNVVQRLEGGVEDKLEAWGNKTSRQKYAKDTNYINFRQSIYEVQYPDQSMPPLNHFIQAEEGDRSDDDEIEVGGTSQVYTCPLTLTILENPVTSRTCRHSFSKAAIEAYFNRNQTISKKCPATGCNEKFKLTDLQPNAELENKVQQHLRRERRRQAEAEEVLEDDEVIE